MADEITGYTLPSGFRWAKTGTTSLGIGPGGEGGTRIGWNSQYYTFQVQYRERKRYSPSGYTAAHVAPAQQWTDWTAWTDPEDAVADDMASSCSKSGRSITYTGHQFGYSYDITTYDMYQLEVRVRVFDEPSLTCSQWAYASLAAVIRPQAALTALPNATGGYDVTVTLTNWERGGNSVAIADSRYCMTNVRDENLGPWWNNSYRWSGVTVQVGSGTSTFTVPAVAASYGRIYAAAMRVTTGDGGVCVLDSSNVYPYDCAADSHTASGSHSADATVYMVPIGPHSDPSGVDEPTVTTSEDSNSDLFVTVSGGTWDGVSVWYTWEDARGVVQHAQVAMAEDEGVWEGLITAPPFDVEVEVVASVRTGNAWMTRSTTAQVSSHGAVELWSVATGGRLRILYNARQTIQRRFDAEVEVVKLAGAGRPKSRHGVGGTMGLTVTGVCVAEGATAGWLAEHPMSDFVPLEGGHDWLLRLPGGERYTVALTAYTLDNAEMAGFYEVGLDLQVVQDGLD